MEKKNITIEILPSFLSLLTLLFVALKLTGYITWSWFWVLSPIWMPLYLFVLLLLFVLRKLEE